MAGLFDDLKEPMMSPLFLGGMGLAFGGAQGMNGGVQSGIAAQKNTYDQRQNAARDQFMQGFDPNDPKYHGLNPGLVDLAQGTNSPELLGKAFLSKGDQEAALAQAKAMGDIQAGIKMKEMQFQSDMQRAQRANDLDVISRIYGMPGATQAAGIFNPQKPQIPNLSAVPVGGTIDHPTMGKMVRQQDGKWYPAQPTNGAR